MEIMTVESRSKSKSKSLSLSAGSSAIFFEQLDISDSASIRDFAKRVGDKHKDVTFLLNNAGKCSSVYIAETKYCCFIEPELYCRSSSHSRFYGKGNSE